MTAPERWLVLTARIAPAGAGGDAPALSTEALAEGLLALGGRAVVEEPTGALVTHLPPPDDLDAFLADARRRLRDLCGGRPVTLEWAWQPHEAWEETWKAGLEPRRVTERIVVAPSWSRPEGVQGELLLVLDPGMAFGTAEHGTTRGCLRLLDGRISPGERVADVGAGSGILASAAALLGVGRVLAVEADPWAVEPARANVRANGVEGVVDVVEARVTEAYLAGLDPFDGVVANMESGILTALLPGFGRSVVAGGWLVLGGILVDECETMEGTAAAHGFELADDDRDGEWWSGAFRRRGSRPRTSTSAPSDFAIQRT